MQMESVNNSAAYTILGDKWWARDWVGQSKKDVKPYMAVKEVGKGRPGRVLCFHWTLDLYHFLLSYLPISRSPLPYHSQITSDCFFLFSYPLSPLLSIVPGTI